MSLSGGADSSAVATLCYLMVRFACQELGQAKLCERLHYIESLADSDDAEQIVQQLLTTVYQSTRNSSQTTRDAASGLAASIQAHHLELDVDQMVQGYIQLIESAVERPLTWEQDDLALQNIQARARGPSVWMLANLRGALLLATSNRSEAAVGYATMDGDTCGGLVAHRRHRQGIPASVAACGWRTKGPTGLDPIPALGRRQRSAAHGRVASASDRARPTRTT